MAAGHQRVQPVFIFSLPRSGSTLLQRVLATHEGMATTAEPWLLLPLLGPLRPRIPHAGGWLPESARNLQELATRLPHGLADYEHAAREAALEIYGAASPPGSRWFIDKTPPYYLIAEEVMRAFPGGRFIFLWRHPLSVVASIAETFTHGRWKPGDYVTSLFVGVDNLVRASRSSDERAIDVRFEDLVQGGSRHWERVLAHLDVPFEPSALERFSALKLEGRMGDPTGVHRYRKLSEEPVSKWRDFVSNPLRRAWCERYLRWLGEERLQLMGYDQRALLDELASTPVGAADLGSDAYQLARALARDVIKAQVIRPRPPTSFRYMLGAHRADR